MPIPGPFPATPNAVEVPPTGSPFWLRLNGAWVWLEGVLPGVPITSDRPGSEFTSIDGNRYVQRGRLARRSWTLSYRWASSAAVAALVAASESREEVWLASEAALASNMLARLDGFGGPTGDVVDCDGLPLRALEELRTVTARVRPGAPATLSAWASGAGVLAAITEGLAAPAVLETDAAGRAAVTVTPVDHVLTIVVGPVASSGWMLTEDVAAPAVFAHGEAMPCPVVVDEVDDQLTTHHGGRYRHDYQVKIREVG